MQATETKETTKTRTIAIDETVWEQLRQRAVAHSQDVNEYATAFISENIRRETEQVLQRGKLRAELDGPFIPFDPDATYKRYKEKYGLPDLSHLSAAELDEAADRSIEAMSPEVRAELKRDGFL